MTEKTEVKADQIMPQEAAFVQKHKSMKKKLNSIVLNPKSFISWKIDEQSSGLLQAQGSRPFFICFTPQRIDRSSQVTYEFRRVSMGDLHFTSDPLTGEFKFEALGDRNLLDSKEFLVVFVPAEGITDDILIKVHFSRREFTVAENEIVVDEFSKVSWVIRDMVSVAVSDFELT